MATMPERMAVIETEVKALKVSVAAIGADVKTLLENQIAQQAISTQRAQDAADCATERWHRNPLIISGIAVTVAVAAFLIDNIVHVVDFIRNLP